MKRRKYKPDSGAEEIVRIATEETVPKLTPREYPSPLQRRAHRLIPAIPALTPASQWADDEIKK